MSRMPRAAAARMALSLVCEPGDPRLPALVAEHGAAEVLDAVERGHAFPGAKPWPDAWTERARTWRARSERATSLAAQAEMTWISPGHPQWPPQLEDLDHAEPVQGATGAPLGLWVRGTGRLSTLCELSVAIVGARDCTPYGAEVAAEIGADVADNAMTVVSGAAFGIDAAGHRGALALDRPTVAVLAGGADVDYPRAHAALLSRVAEVGLVVSEQAPGQAPTKARFLSRNRLIAALAGATVVVEARRRSGSLNTLRWADQLGRPTMAVPGAVTSPQSGGTHEAIRSGQAVLVTSGTEVVAEIVGPTAEVEAASDDRETAFDRLPVPARRALDALSWREPRTRRDVALAAGLAPQQVSSALALLERRGYVGTDGRRWLLVRRADLA